MSRFPFLLSYRLLAGSVKAVTRVRVPESSALESCHVVSFSGCTQTRQRHHQGAVPPHHCRSPLLLQPAASPASLSLPQTPALPCHPPWICAASFSSEASKKTEDSGEKGEPAAVKEGEEKLGIFQRFKRAYKQHGKVLVAVHVATSIVWYGSFYTAARCGLDLVPWMEQWGFSETVIKPFRAGGLGDFALAYLMYKLATPARYTVTLAGTNLAIRQLRDRGRMAPKSSEDSLRQLYRDSKQQLKDSKLRQERLKRLRAAREKQKEKKWRQRH